MIKPMGTLIPMGTFVLPLFLSHYVSNAFPRSHKKGSLFERYFGNLVYGFLVSFKVQMLVRENFQMLDLPLACQKLEFVGSWSITPFKKLRHPPHK